MKKISILIAGILIFTFFNLKVVNAAREFDGGQNIYFDYVPTYNESYYNSLAGLTGQAFKSELSDIISANHKRFGYNSRYTVLREADAVHNKSGKVWGIYTGKIFSESEAGSGGTESYNTEHSWPKSNGFPSSGSTPYTDMNHLRISEAQTNSYRGNSVYGEVSGGKTDSYGNSWTSSVFEPRDSVKGDAARMMFYMAVRYEGDNGEPDLEVVRGTSWSKGEMPNLDTLLKWHREDPVDDRERKRNDVVFKHQKNRNPFIDHPDYASIIWGGATEQTDAEKASYFDTQVTKIISQDSGLTSANNMLTYYNGLTAAQKALTTKYTDLTAYIQSKNTEVDNTNAEKAKYFDDEVTKIIAQDLGVSKANEILAYYNTLTTTQRNLTTKYDDIKAYIEGKGEVVIPPTTPSIYEESLDDFEILGNIISGNYNEILQYL